MDLFEYQPRVVQQTSIDALRSIERVIPPMDARVLNYIKNRPSTCWEIEQESELAHQTASSCLRRLTQRGQIIDSGDRRTTGSGRKAIVWRLTTAEEKES